MTSFVSIFVYLCLTSTLFVLASSKDDEYVVVCYYTNWSQYGGGVEANKYFVSDIDPTLCTHIAFSFAAFNADGTIKTLEWNDLTLYGDVLALKKTHPKLKVSLALGGWTFGVAKWTAVTDTEASTRAFANKALAYLRTHKFDGLDLDWEFPAQRGSPAEDKQRFTRLTEILREVFEEEAKSTAKQRLELTAAVGASGWAIQNSYEPSKISKALDKLHLMAYDMQPMAVAGHHSAFNSSAVIPDNNFVKIADLWISKGADPKKLVFGLGSYGRRQKLANETMNSSGAPVKDLAANNLTAWSFISYRGICGLGGTELWLPEEYVPYKVDGDAWIGYDNAKSIEKKAEWVKENNFGGVMLWSLEQDDFDGISCNKGKYPLLRAAASVLMPPLIENTQNPPSAETTQNPPSAKTTQNPPSAKTTQNPVNGGNRPTRKRCPVVGDGGDRVPEPDRFGCGDNVDSKDRSPNLGSRCSRMVPGYVIHLSLLSLLLFMKIIL